MLGSRGSQELPLLTPLGTVQNTLPQPRLHHRPDSLSALNTSHGSRSHLALTPSAERLPALAAELTGFVNWPLPGLWAASVHSPPLGSFSVDGLFSAQASRPMFLRLRGGDSAPVF